MAESGQSGDTFTTLLQEWKAGDRSALDQLFVLVESELRRIAHSHMARERAGHTLQTTALVNEAYVRLARMRRGQDSARSRSTFYQVAAKVMREILIDNARARLSAKRGAGVPLLPLGVVEIPKNLAAEDLLELHEALGRFAEVDSRGAKMVELYYFVGMTQKDVGECLEVSRDTVKRELDKAKRWLRVEMAGGHNDT